MVTDRIYRFGRFELNARTAELHRAGVAVRLADKPARLLVLLVERAGETVSREELQNHLWPGIHVERDRGLNNAVNRIREALGDAAGEPRFIVTAPKRGYRFIAPVQAASPASPAAPVRRRLSADTWRSVAALSLAVAALSVGWGVLNRAPAESPARALTMAAGQQETLSVASLEVSRRLLQQAVGVDPAYAPAHAALALNSLELVEHGVLDPVEGRTTARYSADRALELSPRACRCAPCERARLDADGLPVAGCRTRAACLRAAVAAVRGRPSNVRESGRRPRTIRRSAPDHRAGHRSGSHRGGDAGPCGASVAVCGAVPRGDRPRARRVASAPRFAPAYKVLSDALWADGETLAAERAYLEWLSALSIDAQELARARALVDNGGLPALWRSNLSRGARTGPYRYGVPFKEASIYAAMGEANRALDALEAAEAQRDSQLIFVKVNPLFTALRGEPRFEALLGRLSLLEHQINLGVERWRTLTSQNRTD